MVYKGFNETLYKEYINFLQPQSDRREKIKYRNKKVWFPKLLPLERKYMTFEQCRDLNNYDSRRDREERNHRKYIVSMLEPEHHKQPARWWADVLIESISLLPLYCETQRELDWCISKLLGSSTTEVAKRSGLSRQWVSAKLTEVRNRLRDNRLAPSKHRELRRKQVLRLRANVLGGSRIDGRTE